MLSKGDDYPIHQTAEPVAYAGTDRNFYDRYFFNGYAPDGSGFFAIAFGVYPHLDVADAWRVRPGHRATLRPDVPGAELPIESEAFAGRVVFVDPQIDPDTQTCRVVAEVANRDGTLRAGIAVLHDARACLHKTAQQRLLGDDARVVPRVGCGRHS